VPPMAAGPGTPVAPPVAPPAQAPAPDAPAEPTVPDAQASAAGDDELEREVGRYRDALRSGTICGACGEANPPDSQYCSDCGTRLQAADTREFE
jgi:hypothetical protein